MPPQRVVKFPDLSPKTQKQLLQGEIGTQLDPRSQLFAYTGDGDLLDYGLTEARDLEVMLERDGQAAAIEAVLTLPIRQASRAIEQGHGDSGEAEFARSVLMTPATGGGMKTPLQDVIGQLTSAQTYKAAFFEKVHSVRDSDGRIIYDKLAYRPPATCEIKRDERTAAFDGFRQMVYMFGDQAKALRKTKVPGYVDIPAVRSFVYINGKHKNPLTGWSEMQISYWALAYNSKVQTPNGPVAIEDLSVGDLVFGGNGEPVEVTDVIDRGVQPMYRVGFDDGTSVLCSGDHLWTVDERRTDSKWRTKTVPTSYMLETGVRQYGTAKFMIPLCGEVQYPERDLIIDPYVLGAWLGDGGCQKTSSGPQSPQFTCHNKDIQIIEEIAMRLPPGIELRRRSELHHGVVDTLKVKLNRFRDAVVTLGLAVKAPEKFIPEIYLTASPKQRWDLLRGLMDTDGCATGGVRSLFTSTSQRLARDVQTLVQSLGGKASISGPHFSDGGTLNGHVITRRHGVYRVCVKTPQPAFLLKRKADKWGGGDLRPKKNNFKQVVSITPEGEKECRCITVANEDGLFLTDSYVVTHNCWRTKMKLLFLLQSSGYSFWKLNPSPR